MRAAIYLTASLALAPIGGQAAPINTLANLFDGASLAIDHYDVHNWSLDSNVSDVAIDFGQIMVQIQNSYEGFTLNYDFNNQLSISTAGSIDIDFSYSVTDFARPHFIGNVLELTDPLFSGSAPNSGSIVVTEDVFCGGPPGGYLVGQKRAEIDPDAGINTPVDAAQFLCKQDLWIEKHIVITSEGSTVSLGDMHQTFIPVPATAALLALGLFGIRCTSRRAT